MSDIKIYIICATIILLAALVGECITELMTKAEPVAPVSETMPDVHKVDEHINAKSGTVCISGYEFAYIMTYSRQVISMQQIMTENGPKVCSK